MNDVLDSPQHSLDHPSHAVRPPCKDAQQQQQRQRPLQRRQQQQQPTQQAGGFSAAGAKLLRLARLSPPSSVTKQGLRNLPPSGQGSITPCSSREEVFGGAAADASLQTADVCDATIDVTSPQASSSGGSGVCGQHQQHAVVAHHHNTAAPSSCRTTSALLTACALQAAKLRLLSCALTKPAAAPSTKLPRLPPRGPKCLRQQRGASLQPLSLSGRPAGAQHKLKKQQPRSFQATGRENIRLLLAPNVCGSITRFKMLMLAEQVHEAHLQAVLSQSLEQTDWAGDAAWQEDFSHINNKFAQRVRAYLFWWGGALAHIKVQAQREEEQECSSPSEAGARVAVVVSGEAAQKQKQKQGGAAAASTTEHVRAAC